MASRNRVWLGLVAKISKTYKLQNQVRYEAPCQCSSIIRASANARSRVCASDDRISDPCVSGVKEPAAALNHPIASSSVQEDNRRPTTWSTFETA